MSVVQQPGEGKRLLVVAAVYAGLLTAIVGIWAFGGRNETHYWPFLLVWALSGGCFLASAALARARRTMASASLLIAGGTLTAPLGIPAVVIGWLLLGKVQGKRSIYPLGVAVAAAFCIVMLMAALPEDVRMRSWRGPAGLLRGAPLSWCWPSNLQALLKGAKYDTLRHRGLLCVDVNDTVERVSFAKLGYGRDHMRRANEILLKHVDPDLPRDAGTEVDGRINAYVYRRSYEDAQKEAVGYLIENLDRQKLRENGLLPVIIVDDALTTEGLLTLGAGIIVKARLMAYSRRGDDE